MAVGRAAIVLGGIYGISLPRCRTALLQQYWGCPVVILRLKHGSHILKMYKMHLSNNQLTPGFMIIHGNQPELLCQLLVSWIRAYPLEPLENETILVQSNGIAQWLKLAFATDSSSQNIKGCGISAAVETILPSRFVWKAYRALLGKDCIPDSSAYDKPLLLWRLMRILPELIPEKEFGPLARFLSDDPDCRKRYQLAERIADLFDQYQVYRADWLAAWASGGNITINERGNSSIISQEHAWQPLLWRRLIHDIGESGITSRAAIHQRFLAAASDGISRDRPASLPRRIIVFGLSSLPSQSLEVLSAISRWSQVLLFVHNPCEHYWANIISEQELVQSAKKRHAEKPGMPVSPRHEELYLHAHPLLAAWGRQGRDYISLLDKLDDTSAYRRLFEEVGQRIDLFQPHGNTTLLNQLQNDILQLRSPTETRKLWPAVNPLQDQSILFHIAHSPQREVEILQDQLLAAFDADPSLKPRDIIVMVPDINAFGPHIQAVFGQIEESDTRNLPFSIVDLGKRHHNPLMNAVEFLLGLNESRLGVSDIMDFLGVSAVRTRFGINETDLPQLHQWIHDANIRWGLDGQQRQNLGVEFAYDQNTWKFGIKRMLLGYAAGGDPTGRTRNDWNHIEPYTDIAGLDGKLLGSLVNLISRIESLIQIFSEPATAPVWVDRMQNLLLDFFDCSSTEETYLLLQLQTILDNWIKACQSACFDELLPLSIVREHWLAQIDQEKLSQRFFDGKLTFATLMPMRAIPFRMVCLLGMNDADYPRNLVPMDFDLMAKDYRPGDRSRREDDRYLFLEAILSARNRLHISWVGHSIHDNTERPPSVLVSQLRDHIAACWTVDEQAIPVKRLIDCLTVKHKLQPFSSEYFSIQERDTPLFTYAREWEPDWQKKKPVSPMEHTPLPFPVFDEPVSLARLIHFLKDPVKTFFRDRLGIYYEMNKLTSKDQEPFAIDALAEWSIQDELIRAREDALFQGLPQDKAIEAQLRRIKRRGCLPPGNISELLETRFLAPLEEMFSLYQKELDRWPYPLQNKAVKFKHIFSGQTIEFSDWLTHIRMDSSENRCRIQLSSSNLIMNQKYRYEKLIQGWVAHLAGHLDDRPLTTVLIGKNGRIMLRPLKPDAARKIFTQLLEAYATGLRYPLPFAALTSLAWLQNQGEEYSGPIPESINPALIHTVRRIYEGHNSANLGESAGNPYLQRAYPTFDTLWSGGEFTCWSHSLMSGLIHACENPP